MRSRIGVLVAVLGLAALFSPGRARADSFDTAFCTANLLSICMDFNLTQGTGSNSSNYSLLVTYVSSTGSPTGMMTAGGIYDIYSTKSNKSPNPSFAFSNVTLVPLTGWSVGCNGLNGSPASTFLACASTTNGINNALAPTNGFTVTFASSKNIAMSDFGASGELGYRSFIQGAGPRNCSIKPDSRWIGNVVGGAAAVDADCSPTSTVPEPATLLLLGAGLVGLAGARRIRRRREAVSG